MAIVLDLFSGCGGLSLGAARAGLAPSVAVELETRVAEVHSRNFPHCKTSRLDLSMVGAADIATLLSVRADLIIGGPPCQGFSFIGKRDLSDPRNALLDGFFKIVAQLKPRAFVMENVPGLLAAENVPLLEAALDRVARDYVILPPTVLDASQFGAATRRKRVVVIGYDPKDVDPFTFDSILAGRLPPVDVQSALAGLPEPEDSDQLTVYALENPYIKRINRLVAGVGSHESISRYQSNKVSGFARTIHSSEVVRRFSSTEQGGTDKQSRLFRLLASEPARTLRAGTGPERGSFQSARPIHHISPRVITVREAARIQGFPDWFEFHPTKWHSHRMIGNSVCPIFAEAVLKPLAISLGVSPITSD